ncbi:MAG: glycosyltransferase family 4 protein [Chloroflexi bacterium]|nr:glycosyltransferase family 4 protein [Chloroflexota bacterium]MBV9601893.1 glycosyltransferase family 4 protein [Chloroflexota bacterium]
MTQATDGPLIAIDARLIGYAAGIAQYARLLTDALSELQGPERYLILRGRHTRQQRVGGRRVFTPPHNRLERWSLPLELMARPPWPTLLHSVDHVAPAWRKWRSVVTLHDLAFLLYPATHTAQSRAYYAACGESVRQAERVIAVSQRTASDAVRLLGVDPARMRVVPEAAAPGYAPRDEGAFQSTATRLSLDHRPYALFVGTLEPRKNVPVLLEAFVQVRRQLDAQLLVVGGRGWLDEPIFAAHARSGLGGAVRFLGTLDQDDLAALYSRAGVFVLPSVYEGFGLPVLEAMACGAPVVCSNAGPLPEVAGDAALLLPPEDAGKWAQVIVSVLADARQADGLRQKGFARAATFSWERAALATREVYREALLA